MDKSDNYHLPWQARGHDKMWDERVQLQTKKIKSLISRHDKTAPPRGHDKMCQKSWYQLTFSFCSSYEQYYEHDMNIPPIYYVSYLYTSCRGLCTHKRPWALMWEVLIFQNLFFSSTFHYYFVAFTICYTKLTLAPWNFFLHHWRVFEPLRGLAMSVSSHCNHSTPHNISHQLIFMKAHLSQRISDRPHPYAFATCTICQIKL
jgi:hypothetical protein